MNSDKETFVCLVLLIAISAILYSYTGENAYRMEHTRRFSYANPLYLFNVLGSICSLGLGFWSILKLYQFSTGLIKKEK